VLTDIVMPGMSGYELVGRLIQTMPELKALYMSGYSGEAIDLGGELKDNSHFIQKPFSPQDLAGKVREVLGPFGKLTLPPKM